jgi:hypothetical protein
LSSETRSSCNGQQITSWIEPVRPNLDRPSFINVCTSWKEIDFENAKGFQKLGTHSYNRHVRILELVVPSDPCLDRPPRPNQSRKTHATDFGKSLPSHQWLICSWKPVSFDN